MVKSFQTSGNANTSARWLFGHPNMSGVLGGTVLSTNWDEVAKKDYEKERVAPDGMEWRDWEGDKIKSEEGSDSKK